MALKFIDGFEIYGSSPNLMARRYRLSDLGVSTFVSGRSGYGKALQFRGPLAEAGAFSTPDLGNEPTLIVGFAFANYVPAGTGEFVLLEFSDSGIVQVDLRFNTSTQVLSVTNNGDVLATGTTELNTGVLFYVELKVTISNSIGYIELHLNENTEFSASNIDTQASANSYANQITFRNPVGWYNVYYQLDDLYVCDGTGANNNTFLGDVSVEALVPTGSGTNTQWTSLSSSPNWQAAASIDSNVIETDTSGDIDTYLFSSLRNITTDIKGVSVDAYATNTTPYSHNLTGVTRTASTNYANSNPVTLSGVSYQYYSFIYEQNPNTSASWTTEQVNNSEFGIKLL